MMVQWLRLASLLPCALALRASEPPHHARQVAIIGKSTFLEDGYAGTESQQVQVQVAHPLRTISPSMLPRQAFRQTSPSSNVTITLVVAQQP